MISFKRVIDSALLGRKAHADVFEIGASPDFLFILFGGSGVDEEEYDRRSQSVIPVFGPLLDSLARRSLNLVMVYVSAPYDVPFNRFATEPDALSTWNAHVATELLQPWNNMPYFVSGFSGGAALALNGLQVDRRCFGGAALGADAIPPDFIRPGHWTEKLRLYAAPHDRVCNHPGNKSIVADLVSAGQASLVKLPAGEHSLGDYSTKFGLGDLIGFASDLVPRLSAPGESST